MHNARSNSSEGSPGVEKGVRAQFTNMFGDHGFDCKTEHRGNHIESLGDTRIYVGDPPAFLRKGRQRRQGVLRNEKLQPNAFAHPNSVRQQMWETAAEEGERAATNNTGGHLK